MESTHDNKIFKLNRIKYEELWQDALTWVKKTYKAANQKFNSSSPFSQLLSVVLHLGRMIFYYIEDSITGLNMKTAYRPDQIKGLASLTGHDAGRVIAARGAIKISYKESGNNDYNGEICYISSKSRLYNSLNGSSYVVLFSADNARITMTAGNYVEATIIQGTLKYQQSTSNGTPLQSFNFSERDKSEIDQYYVNVYVNGERWEIVSSLLDMTYNQKACIVRTGNLDGIDVFFGNGTMGKIPENGATILVEYIVSVGNYGNVPKESMNSSEYWQWKDSGFLEDGTTVDLDSNFSVTCLTDIIFGTKSEDTALTQLIAPHASRSMVLASKTNYEYFLKKMNMFSIIEVIPGYISSKSSNANYRYEEALRIFNQAQSDYSTAVSAYGEDSEQAKEAEQIVEKAGDSLSIASEMLEDSSLNDNTVYLMLVPDISTRISSATNYFTCDESLFSLSADEQYNIINLIEMSGQRCLTIENKILSPKNPRFAINVDARIWSDSSYNEVYNESMSKLSEYFLSLKRRDRIPLSDIIALLEDVSGIDSVRVSFDADVNNSYIYQKSTEFYGIDEYGDIIMTRSVTDNYGNVTDVHDIYPLFRGGFSSSSGIVYGDVQSQTDLSGFNLNVIGTSKSKNN